MLLRAGAERTLTLGAGAPRALPAGQPAAGWRSLYTATPSGRGHHRRARRRRHGAHAGLAAPARALDAARDGDRRRARRGDRRRADARPRARGRARDAVRPGRRVAAPAAAHRHAPRPLRLRRHRPRRAADVPHRAARRAATTSSATTTSCATSSCPAPSSTSASRTSAMEGQPVARAVPAAAPWVYTLYRKAAGPFVHALNTEGFALCIDLPAAARSGAAAAREWGLVLSPDDVDALRRQPRARPRRRDRRRRAPGSGAPPASPAARSARRRGWRSRPTARTLYVPTARRASSRSTPRRWRCGARCCRPSGERGRRRGRGGGAVLLCAGRRPRPRACGAVDCRAVASLRLRARERRPPSDRASAGRARSCAGELVSVPGRVRDRASRRAGVPGRGRLPSPREAVSARSAAAHADDYDSHHPQRLRPAERDVRVEA